LIEPAAQDLNKVGACVGVSEQHWRFGDRHFLRRLCRKYFDRNFCQEEAMAKKKKRKYSRGASQDVESEMHRYKRGTAKSGRGGKGGKVKSREQAIAIGLSKARKEGKKVPPGKRK
jgi:Family of unknown function (DUF6496)